jgi:hypothetical protein
MKYTFYSGINWLTLEWNLANCGHNNGRLKIKLLHDLTKYGTRGSVVV